MAQLLIVEGQLVGEGLSQSPEVSLIGWFGIVSGTDGFHKALGEARLVAPTSVPRDVTFDLDVDSTRRMPHGADAP
jgi:hypothetical protein